MTEKEEIVEAKKLKAEIDARNQPKEWKPHTKKKLAEDNRIRYKPKRRAKDIDDMLGTKRKVSKHHDSEWNKY